MPKIVCTPEPSDDKTGLCRTEVRIPQRGIKPEMFVEVIERITKEFKQFPKRYKDEFDTHLTNGECVFWFVINPKACEETMQKVRFLHDIVKMFGLTPVIDGSITSRCNRCQCS